MRAIVLVGGEGTRLRPLTWRTPKQLVPVLNRPLLEHLLRHLRSHGVRDVTLALTDRNSAIRDAFGAGEALDLSVAYAYEDEPLGSGGAIAAVAAGWDSTFLVLNGDIVTDLDLDALLTHHQHAGAEVSIALHEVDDPSPFGVVALAGGGRIARFVEKPSRDEAPSRLINAGTWVFEPSVLGEMDRTRFNRVEDELFPRLAASGRGIHGFHVAAFWRDVGRPEHYRAVNLELLAGAIAGYPPDMPSGRVLAEGVTTEDGAEMLPPALAGPGTTIGAGALVRDAVIGKDCRIGAGARVTESVLWDGVEVEERATVPRSILATGARVGAGAAIEGAVLGHRAQIPAHSRPAAGIRVEPAGQAAV